MKQKLALITLLLTFSNNTFAMNTKTKTEDVEMIDQKKTIGDLLKELSKQGPKVFFAEYFYETPITERENDRKEEKT